MLRPSYSHLPYKIWNLHSDSKSQKTTTRFRFFFACFLFLLLAVEMGVNHRCQNKRSSTTSVLQRRPLWLTDIFCFPMKRARYLWNWYYFGDFPLNDKNTTDIYIFSEHLCFILCNPKQNHVEFVRSEWAFTQNWEINTYVLCAVRIAAIVKMFYVCVKFHKIQLITNLRLYALTFIWINVTDKKDNSRKMKENKITWKLRMLWKFLCWLLLKSYTHLLFAFDLPAITCEVPTANKQYYSR